MKGFSGCSSATSDIESLKITHFKAFKNAIDGIYPFQHTLSMLVKMLSTCEIPLTLVSTDLLCSLKKWK